MVEREVVNVRLSTNDLTAIDKIVEKDEVTRSDVIRLLLKEALSARARKVKR